MNLMNEIKCQLLETQQVTLTKRHVSDPFRHLWMDRDMS